MKEIQYRNFSSRIHRRNWRINRPNVCEFELTFRCALRCSYCGIGRYNEPGYLKNELKAKEIRVILDKIHKAGVFWICFTGGDPLARKDFLEIYSYAKKKGFIITVFTSGYHLTENIIRCFKKKPPFSLEINLNGVDADLYEKMTAVKGSFAKVMNAVKAGLKARLPLKIKTQVTKDNIEALPTIRRFVESLGLKLHHNSILQAGLIGDKAPCGLRISPQQFLEINGIENIQDSDCKLLSNSLSSAKKDISSMPEASLFPCAIGGGDNMVIDPFGNLVPCFCIREPKANLIREEIDEARKKILDWSLTLKFTSHAKCKNCSIKELCYSCPGKALLETGSLEGHIDWFCELASLLYTGKK